MGVNCPLQILRTSWDAVQVGMDWASGRSSPSEVVARMRPLSSSPADKSGQRPVGLSIAPYSVRPTCPVELPLVSKAWLQPICPQNVLSLPLQLA